MPRTTKKLCPAFTFIVVTSLLQRQIALLRRFPFDASQALIAQNHESEQKHWILFEQFRTQNSTEPSNKTMPAQHEWLIGGSSKPDSTSSIPKQIFKVNLHDHGLLEDVFSNNTSEGTKSLKEAHLSWRERNPGYQIKYFDLNSCRKYLHRNFHPIFLRAFDCLQPYAFKADLFRYLVLYKEGGWYSDWKQKCLMDHLLDTLSAGGNKTWFSAWNGPDSSKSHSNGILGAMPQHPVLRNVISRVINNVQSIEYGSGALSPTGPSALGDAVNEEGYGEVNATKAVWYTFNYKEEKNGFYYEDQIILQHKCTGCGLTSWKDGGNGHYAELWKQKRVFCPEASTLFETPFS